MSWKRLPTYFLSFPLRLLPLSEKQQKVYETTGHLTELAFKTVPSAGKFEIRQYLEQVYGLSVSKVRTLNVEGRKKRSKHGFYRRPDYKKAYVTLKNPAASAATTTA